MLVKSSINCLMSVFTNMKVTQNHVLPASRVAEMILLGQRLARLRIARHMTQAEAAVRAGLSRNTAYRLEKGDAGLAIGQVLRYIEAIAPATSLLELLQAEDPALAALEAGEKRKRTRGLSKEELTKLDF
jgi:transcriptional regulator with XRE-family HTH domain